MLADGTCRLLGNSTSTTLRISRPSARQKSHPTITPVGQRLEHGSSSYSVSLPLTGPEDTTKGTISLIPEISANMWRRSSRIAHHYIASNISHVIPHLYAESDFCYSAEESALANVLSLSSFYSCSSFSKYVEALLQIGGNLGFWISIIRFHQLQQMRRMLYSSLSAELFGKATFLDMSKSDGGLLLRLLQRIAASKLTGDAIDPRKDLPTHFGYFACINLTLESIVWTIQDTTFESWSTPCVCNFKRGSMVHGTRA